MRGTLLAPALALFVWISTSVLNDTDWLFHFGKLVLKRHPATLKDELYNYFFNNH
jgi:hypothetical protein